MSETVAIVGMGAVLPGINGADDLWEHLMSGEPPFRVDPDRCPPETFGATHSGGNSDRADVLAGGVISDEAGREHARTGDADSRAAPQQAVRWLREAAAQALRGVRTSSDDDCTSVIGAISEGDHLLDEGLVRQQLRSWTAQEYDADTAERVAAVFDQHYPNAREPSRGLAFHTCRDALRDLLPPGTHHLVVDSACSASLHAIDLAVKEIRRGQDLAICGGVYSVTPRYQVLFSALKGLSESGRVRSLGPEADGTLFSDGAGVVVLKRHEKALRDGDPVLGTIAGFGAASNGKTAVNAPHPAAQRRAVENALDSSGLVGRDIDWVIAHATGTPAGDEAELGMLRSLTPRRGWVLTSNKQLIGHTGPAAGIISTIHALLAMRHGRIPPQRPDDCHPATGDELEPLEVPRTERQWSARDSHPRTAAVMAFGFGGTNTCLLLRDRPSHHGGDAPATESDPLVVIDWTAHLPGAPTTDRLQHWLTGGSRTWADSFGPSYPAPGPHVIPLTPRALRAVDREQLMTASCVQRLSTELPEELRTRTGIVGACHGPSRTSCGNVLRCYLDDLSAKMRHDAVAEGVLNRFGEHVRTVVPATSSASVSGLMSNIGFGRAATQFGTGGFTLRLEAGRDTSLAALTTALRAVSDHDIDVGLVLAVSGHAPGPVAAALLGPDANPAEGAFGLAVARRSVAEHHRLPVLGRLALSEANHGDATEPVPDDRAYLGAEGIIAALRGLVRSDGAATTVSPVASRAAPSLLVTPPTTPKGDTTT
ncbi:beta-ketoacyl [acyl carrier protein] synthase domain-containing protein [Actinopolyspora erythraea]|nr:polyketide synthase [Actinopolyspora erythraea]